MKSYRRMLGTILLLIGALFLAANLFLLRRESSDSGRYYRVEIARLALEIEEKGSENIDISGCEYVTAVEQFSPQENAQSADFYHVESDYVIREIGGELYRFDYELSEETDDSLFFAVNAILAVMALAVMGVLLFVRSRILAPFSRLTELPYELSKGNLTVPIKESKNRFFGRFIWGVDLLRENMEQAKKRELELQKEKKTLLLSLSHDIKTPLSAIKLYTQALSKGLYPEREKQLAIAENINVKANEIESFVAQIVKASNEDFLALEVQMGEFYLSELIQRISGYYREKLELVHINFHVGDFTDCILKGDLDRSEEVLQNLIENAIKYGDGHGIELLFGEEDGCQLVTVKNTGCTLPENEMPHIFESFYRGSNVGSQGGSGLGLYICRQLMGKMSGDIFGESKDGSFSVTVVFDRM